jgi:hypothetical protein
MPEFLYTNGLVILRRVREGQDDTPEWMSGRIRPHGL